MHAIPTHYNGVNYRSRLEAKWAKFFDSLGWVHHYEPIDFKGYIPDFYISGENPCYVEIKPAMTFKELFSLNQKTEEAMYKNDARVLYLGGIIDYDRGDDGNICLGRLVDYWEGSEDGDRCDYDDEAILIECQKCNRISFMGVWGAWRSHCCDARDKYSNIDKEEIANKWKICGNTVQYNKRLYL